MREEEHREKLPEEPPPLPRWELAFARIFLFIAVGWVLVGLLSLVANPGHIPDAMIEVLVAVFILLLTLGLGFR